MDLNAGGVGVMLVVGLFVRETSVELFEDSRRCW